VAGSRLLIAASVWLLSAGWAVISAAPAQDVPAPAASPVAANHRAVLDKYCVTCHNQKLLTAGLALDKADVTNIPAGAQVWEKVVRKLGTSSMPPLGMPRPDKPTYDAFAAWLENELDRAAAARPNPGRVGVRRLNQFEYTNAVRDLLALEVDGRALLPSDESSDGFDNIAEALSVSPLLLERYMIAAHKIGVLALADPKMPAGVATYRIPALLVQDERMSDDLPIGSRGGTAIRHYFPLNGEYVVKVRLLRAFNAATIRGYDVREQLDVRLDGVRLKLFAVGLLVIGSASYAYACGDDNKSSSAQASVASTSGSSCATMSKAECASKVASGQCASHKASASSASTSPHSTCARTPTCMPVWSQTC